MSARVSSLTVSSVEEDDAADPGSGTLLFLEDKQEPGGQNDVWSSGGQT